ncbi:MAG TPA: NAD(P)/FAD-dependent oxidoreductase [Myxococcaceae bacterium]|nr:NAD(P)/FAD-dependent oxidoreductase [Myxococcaceae bacterium]
METEILIVGAGPSGAAAAVQLGQLGIRDVLLVDRDQVPRNKTCGSGLSPAALHLAEALGIGSELRRLANPVLTVRFVTQSGEELRAPANSAAVILLRKEFDNLLVQRARSLGVGFRGGFRVTDALEDDGRVVGVRGLDGTEIRARWTLFADGAHSLFTRDDRERRHIDTLMGWWEGPDFEPGRLDMIFDPELSPLYGWLFPETGTRVNIGICIDAQDEYRRKVPRDLRAVFRGFLQRHYASELQTARQIGGLKGHPIVHTTWIANVTRPGAQLIGEAARLTHNGTGEGISQAMQSGVYAAEALARVARGELTEPESWRSYVRALRKRFTPGFAAGYLLRGMVSNGMLDGLARTYNSASFQKAIHWLVGAAMTGTTSQEAPAEYAARKPVRPSSRVA